MEKKSFYREQADKFSNFSKRNYGREAFSLFQEWSKGKDFLDKDKKEIWALVQASELKGAYKTIDAIIEEMFLAEEESLQIICSLLESENSKLKSKIIEKIIPVLRQWNKIPATELRAKVNSIISNTD